MNEITGPGGKPISAIIYHDTKPHSVFLGDSNSYQEYYFNWCEKEEVCAYHRSGLGGGGPYVNKYVEPEQLPGTIWIRTGVQVRHASDSSQILNDADLTAMGYRRILEPLDLPALGEVTTNPFEWEDAVEGETVYCSECGSHIWEQWGFDETPCEHLEWCEEHGLWDGPGSTDPCGCHGGVT